MANNEVGPEAPSHGGVTAERQDPKSPDKNGDAFLVVPVGASDGVGAMTLNRFRPSKRGVDLDDQPGTAILAAEFVSTGA
jgi:hypothetical protein